VSIFLPTSSINFLVLKRTIFPSQRQLTIKYVEKSRPTKKKKILFGKLSVKYVILNRIVAVNWVPTTYSSDIANRLGRFIFAIGTKTKMDFGAYIFKQTVRHAKTDAVKFPIAFPTLLCSIILDQQPNIKTVNDVPSKRESPLTLHQKL